MRSLPTGARQLQQAVADPTRTIARRNSRQPYRHYSSRFRLNLDDALVQLWRCASGETLHVETGN
jgi:hypothetical protein